MALMLWKDNPDKFGGLILDAAYPINGVQRDPATGQPKVILHDAHKDEGIKSVPIYVLIGDKDRNVPIAEKLWRAAMEKWQTAGVPVTLNVVPGGGHEWLVKDKKTADALEVWLKDVAAGKLPTESATRQPATKPVE